MTSLSTAHSTDGRADDDLGRAVLTKNSASYHVGTDLVIDGGVTA